MHVSVLMEDILSIGCKTPADPPLQLFGAVYPLTAGLLNTPKRYQTHSHGFGIWCQHFVHNWENYPGSRPRKLEWINFKKGDKKAPTFVFGEGIIAGILRLLQKQYDLSPHSIKRWFWRKRREHMARAQSALRQEWTVQGNEIAAAYFIVNLDGGVLFSGQSKWVRQMNHDDLVFPNHSDIGVYIDAIDLSGAEILYEGLCHFEKLNRVQWLSLRNCPYVDDWFLDRVACVFRNSLTFLDIRDCQHITENGLTILHRLKLLKSLKLSGLKKVKHGPLVCMLLEDAMPQCNIEGTDYWKPEGTDSTIV